MWGLGGRRGGVWGSRPGGAWLSFARGAVFGGAFVPGAGRWGAGAAAGPVAVVWGARLAAWASCWWRLCRAAVRAAGGPGALRGCAGWAPAAGGSPGWRASFAVLGLACLVWSPVRCCLFPRSGCVVRCVAGRASIACPSRLCLVGCSAVRCLSCCATGPGVGCAAAAGARCGRRLYRCPGACVAVCLVRGAGCAPRGGGNWPMFCWSAVCLGCVHRDAPKVAAGSMLRVRLLIRSRFGPGRRGILQARHLYRRRS